MTMHCPFGTGPARTSTWWRGVPHQKGCPQNIGQWEMLVDVAVVPVTSSQIDPISLTLPHVFQRDPGFHEFDPWFQEFVYCSCKRDSREHVTKWSCWCWDTYERDIQARHIALHCAIIKETGDGHGYLKYITCVVYPVRKCLLRLQHWISVQI